MTFTLPAPKSPFTNLKIIIEELTSLNKTLSTSYKEKEAMQEEIDNLKKEFFGAFNHMASKLKKVTPDDENFVVLECVARLLAKGYLPNSIELEPKWSLGRGEKGGKADILIKDNSGDEFLIIECKKDADEFRKSWKKMLIDGDQLFSYAQQIKKTKLLCLYYSECIDGKISYTNKIVSLVDNEDFLKTLKSSEILRYSDSSDVKSLFKVWHDIYNCEFESVGIFEDDYKTYDLKKDSYKVKNLVKLTASESQRKYNDFATILRQHNISGRENAFDKLVNLFLAKIVDEIEHPDDLQFNWRGSAYDDYYSLQDRLQKLYKDGMLKFLNEEVTYIDNKQIDDAFSFFRTNIEATKEIVFDYFRQLKFYTNNDFAFIDVHNQQLFKQNSEILLQMVKLFQDVQLKTEEHNQFLGDLFEGFLDQGVKQNEGQFFTPLPIVRFIVTSLPLSELCKNESTPKILDFACGAGHFLNEVASQIRELVPENKISDFYKNIFGIEKEYRLSKVSKVSAFMYGQDGIDITYGDALANWGKFPNDSIDLIVANPPYSVKGFLETLEQEDIDSFELSCEVSKKNYSTNSVIEAFFIEKAAKLLKDEGIAAIILPSPILSNGGSLHNHTRKIILKYFDIVGISEFGSGTFGKTGTNTVTLFLRKKKKADFMFNHYSSRVDSWFNNDFSQDALFDDYKYFKEFVDKRGFSEDDYKKFIEGTISNSLLEKRCFQNYLKKYGSKINLIKNVEKEKLLYFILAKNQYNSVLVVKSPDNDKLMKKYLGYEWSDAKGNEGIKYLGTQSNADDVSKNRAIDTIVTPLFDPKNKDNIDKINTIIKDNFFGNVRETLPDNCSYFSLTDLIDFEGKEFEAKISLQPTIEMIVNSDYQVSILDDVCNVKIGGTPSRKNNAYFTGNNVWVSIGEMNGQIINDSKEKITDEGVENSNVKLVKKGTTLFSFKLSIGKTAIAGCDLYTNEAIAALEPKKPDELLDLYLFYLFTADYLNANSVGKKAFGKSLNSDYLKYNVKLPVPPKNIQEEFIAACKKIESKFRTVRMTETKYHSLLKDELYRLKILK